MQYFAKMRIKLAHKIFALFVLLSVAVIGLTLGLIHNLTYRIFSEHAAQRRLGEMADLGAALQAHFRENGSFEAFDDKTWRAFARAHDRGPPLPPEAPKRPLPPPGLRPPDWTPPLVLLDRDRNRIAGPQTPLDDLVLAEVKVDGETVGFYGLKIIRQLSHDLNRAYLERQTKAVHITGLAALVAAIVSALLFTRWIVRPIRDLSKSAQQIAKRDYSVRVPVRSGDELGQLARNFNQMAETLQRHEKIRAQWISDISHELRTPLSVLRGNLEAVLDGVRTQDGNTFESLHAEVMRLGRIIEDMRDLTAADNGTFRYALEPVNPLAVLSQTLKLYQTRFAEHQIELTHSLDAEVTVDADRARLEQLYANLLENTLKYTASPGALRISYTLDDANVAIEFEDTPPGVPDGQMDRIFDRLFRVDKARSRETGGSGLGLAICKTIAEAHGGAITAAHSEAGGLSIKVTLPLGTGQ